MTLSTAVPFPGQPADVDSYATLMGLASPSGLVATSPVATVSGLVWTIPVGVVPYIKGFTCNVTAPDTRTATANTNTNPRLDRLVWRLDRVAKTITPVILTGTPAASPQLPTITNPDDIAGWYARNLGSSGGYQAGSVVAEWQPLSGLRADNAWSGSDTYGPGSNGTTMATWANVRTEGLIVRSGSSFQVQQPGLIAIHLEVASSSSYPGESNVQLNWTGGPWAAGLKRNTAHRIDLPDPGNLVQDISWVGVVKPNEIANPITVSCGWTPIGSTSPAAYTADLQIEYLGG